MATWICRRRFRLTSAILALPIFIIIITLSIYRQQNENDDQDMVLLIKKTNRQKEYIDKRGIHVIVGHYIGNDMPWDVTPNLTEEVLNSNQYLPLPMAGERGQPVHVSPHELRKMKALFHINRFNLLVSDRIAVNRSLLDVRKQSCRNKTYASKNLPDTSIIIVFHNEAWSTLMRTVHSIINRSPRSLLKEILLVDDASTRKFLKEELETYVAKLPVPVKIIRAINRTGLIRARLLGARQAIGQVLTFLDAHCECSKGWLEPLLSRISENRTRVVCPVIDIINDDSFSYIKSFELHWGSFNWELHFRWFPVAESELKLRHGDSTKPFKTPVMAGGLFSIDKSYFYEMGTYDHQMDIWGGENIELSFRVWQCGGSIEISPCSHVGHIFRRSSPYNFPRPGGISAVLYANLARVAEVWMDEWKEFFFVMNPEAAKARRGLDVSKRKELRARLQCKSFKWYLENVWPEHFMPTENRFFGKIRNKKSGQCVHRPSGKNGVQHAVGKVPVKDCVIEVYPQQSFVYTREGYVMTDESICMDSPEGQPDTTVVLLACNGMKRQMWKYDPWKYTLVHTNSGLCLDLPNKKSPEGAILQTCNSGKSQQWQLEPVPWRKEE